MESCVPKAWGYTSLLFRVNLARRNAVQAALAAEGLQDVGQPKILFLLKEEGEDGALPAQWELAQRLHISQATVAMSLKSLERMGYIARQADPKDGRKKRIAITEKGRDARTRCISIFDRVDAQLYSGFSQEELTQMKEILQRMLDNLEPIGGMAVPCPGGPERKVIDHV